MQTTIINNVRRELRSAMDDNGLLDTVKSRYLDYDFDVPFAVTMRLPENATDEQYDDALEEAEAIAEAEFNRVVGMLGQASALITEAFAEE